METIRGRLFGLAMLVGLLLALPASAGLYGDPKEVKSGDIADQDYWWAKFDMMMLDLAIEQKQPEGAIAVELASAIRRLDELTTKYPNHEELKKMKEHAKDVEKKIDANADRRTGLQKNCPWGESNFAQLWVNFHYSKMLLADKQWDKAASMLQNVKQNYDIMMKPNRMKEYPEDLRKWVIDHKEEADKMYDEAKSHR